MRIEHKRFLFLKLFGLPRDIPAQSPGYRAKKFGFPGFRRTYRTFGPPPLYVEDPHPTGKYPGSKVWICALLSCLNLRHGFCGGGARIVGFEACIVEGHRPNHSPSNSTEIAHRQDSSQRGFYLTHSGLSDYPLKSLVTKHLSRHPQELVKQGLSQY